MNHRFKCKSARPAALTLALSLVDVGDFPDETVWSAFGQGYGYVPLVLPVLGLWWLWRTGRPADPAAPATSQPLG